MFLEKKLPQGATTTAPTPPKKRVEITVFVDRNYQGKGPTLRVEPRGVLERAAVNEIIETLGFPLRASNAGLGGVRDCVLVAAGIAEKHGWTTFETSLDAEKMLQVKLWKDVDA